MPGCAGTRSSRASGGHRFEIDGIRLDTYPMVERSFWRDWSGEREAAIPGLSVVGEAWVTDPALLSFFQGGRAGWDGVDTGVDWLFDFPLYQAIVEVFAVRHPVRRLSQVFARDGLYHRRDRLITFLDNHDTVRLAGHARHDGREIPAGHRLSADRTRHAADNLGRRAWDARAHGRSPRFPGRLPGRCSKRISKPRAERPTSN